MEPSVKRMNMRFWLILCAAVTAALITAQLGRWQLSRAAQKESLQTVLETRQRMPVLDAAEFLPIAFGSQDDMQALLQRKVLLEGEWLPEHSVYLDNRQMQGRPGFYVVTPFRPTGHTTVVLVQRGWVARNFQDRLQLPPVQTSHEVTQLMGRVVFPPSRLYEFEGTDSAQGSSRIRQNLDLNAFRVETGLDIASLTVLQTGEPGEGLLRDWPVVAAGIDKHYGYAFQWFGLCGLVTLLYVWFQIVRRFFLPHR